MKYLKLFVGVTLRIFTVCLLVWFFGALILSFAMMENQMLLPVGEWGVYVRLIYILTCLVFVLIAMPSKME